MIIIPDKWENAIYAIENIHKDMILHSEKLETAWNYANWLTHCDAFNFLVMAKKEKEYKFKKAKEAEIESVLKNIQALIIINED